RSRPAASNLLRLLHLAKPVQDLLMAGEIDMGHARALLPLAKASQVQLAHRISAKGYSVREAVRMVQHELSPPKKKSAPKKEDRDVVRLEEELADALGAQVKIRMGAKGDGQIAIGFSSLDQLDGILEKLR
ncbi:partial putative chromosome-partitioning protein ParB, partial [Rhodocyclaceae bacterium]